jgi:hypothetical protein
MSVPFSVFPGVLSVHQLDAIESWEARLTYVALSELRNRIYHFAQEQEPVVYALHPRNGPTNYDSLYPMEERIPEYFNLSQVCHQIRTEYSPIYAAETEVHVCHVDLDDFMKNGFPYLTRDKDMNVVGNLFLDCAGLGRPWRHIASKSFPRINILPFLQYCKSSPGLRVRCGLHACDCDPCQKDWLGIKGCAEALLGIHNNSRLQAWLDTAVGAIWLRFEAELTFAIKKGELQDWMRFGGGQYIDEPKDLEYLAWTMETGLKVLKRNNEGQVKFEIY